VPQRDADQREDEWKGLTFSTDPLTAPLDVAGPMVLSLRASTRPLAGVHLSLPLDSLVGALGQPGAAQVLPPYLDADFVVKLSDVAPDGTSTLIQSGFLRASHRLLDPARTREVDGVVTEPWPYHDAEHLLPPEAGTPYTYEIEIWPTAKRFAPGHRLRIALYSADTANHLTLMEPVINTVLGGSYLLLPESG
jgi:predicted acyl esterase